MITSNNSISGLPHWSGEQISRFCQLVDSGTTIAYWNSDQHGRPANSGQSDGWFAKAGLIQEIPGPLALCGPGALHATLKPHRWAGCRVWVVALHGEVKQQEDKLGSLKREFLGEILPEEAFCPSVGVRLGRKDLQSADLRYANLRSANLQGADLQSANLWSANLRSAELQYARSHIEYPGYKLENGILLKK